MTRVSPSIVGVAVMCGAMWSVSVGAGLVPVQEKVNADAELQQDFKKRVDQYVELHKRFEKDVPPLKKKEDPATIKASQEGLAKLIRGARATAKQGEIFTPEIAALFRRLMYPEVKGPEGAATKKVLKEDAPPAIPLKVNAEYPESAALPTVPPNLLMNLPRLPEELEYRIVGKDLILRDVHANTIVDFIPKAIR
jgi:hypothetical protein